MRTMMPAALLFACGVLTMSETATQAPADDKKEKKEKEFPPLKKGEVKFDEKVTVRVAGGDNKPIASTKENVGALRFSSNKGKAFYLSTKDFGAAAIPKGSEVVDEDGFVYVVESNPNTAMNRLVYVKRKP